MIEKHEALIAQAAGRGAQIICLQELFYGPYFCAEQDTKWYAALKPSASPKARRRARFARDRQETRHRAGVAGVRGGEHRRLLQHRGRSRCRRGPTSASFRKMHIPQVQPGFWEKYYFTGPVISATPCSRRALRKVGVYICYDRHFPEGALAAWVWGAPKSFSILRRRSLVSPNISGSWNNRLTPSPTAILSKRRINRPGWEDPWRIGEFYGQKLFLRSARPDSVHGGPQHHDDIVVCDLDLDMIRDVHACHWQFYRDRRPRDVRADHGAGVRTFPASLVVEYQGT